MGCALLAVFAALAVVVTTGHALPWDHSIIDALAGLGISNGLANLSAVLPVLVAAGTLLVLLRQRRFAAAVVWCVTVGGVIVLDPALKALFERPSRNLDSTAYSFPSGTAMLTVAILLALLATLPAGRRRTVAVLGGLFLLAQGIVLVGSGWHYPSDVIAGWCVAGVWAGLVWLVASSGSTAPRFRRAAAAS